MRVLLLAFNVGYITQPSCGCRKPIKQPSVFAFWPFLELMHYVQESLLALNHLLRTHGVIWSLGFKYCFIYLVLNFTAMGVAEQIRASFFYYEAKPITTFYRLNFLLPRCCTFKSRRFLSSC